MNYAMNDLHNLVMKVYNLLAEADVSVTDASYVLQIVQQELIEQGYSPELREIKKKRQEIIDAQWKEWKYQKDLRGHTVESSRGEATEKPLSGTAPVPT